jgi:SAM-dependent methyltransferase
MTAPYRAVVPAHPAPFPDAVIELAREAIVSPTAQWSELRVLDPFAGVGGVHKLASPYIHTVGVELMPKWAVAHRDTIVGDATQLPADWAATFDAVVTSPCYGNRMADHHNASDPCSRCDGDGIEPHKAFTVCTKCKGSGLSHRRSYRHYYGDDFLTSVPLGVNAGVMAWGDEYRELHAKAWAEVERVLRPGGRFVLNVKDHIRNGKRVHVARWHRRTVLALGFEELWRWDIPLDGYGYGANRDARVPTEQVYVFERSAS